MWEERKGVTWKYRTLLCKVWVRCLYSLKTQCTARCLQRVAQRKGDNNRCEMGIRIGVFPLSHTLRATCGTLPSRWVSMRTNSVLTPCKARCGTFTLLLPLLSHTPTSNVRYISFQRNLQLKIHLSSYQFRVTTQVVWCPKKPVWLGAKYAWNDAVCTRRIVSLAYPFTFWGNYAGCRLCALPYAPNSILACRWLTLG